MNKWKSWIGAALIVLSAAGLIFWEMQGREVFLTETVLVAAAEIPAGTIVTPGAFASARVQKENLVAGALEASEASRLTGRRARGVILKNQQIAADYFILEEEQMKKGESVYVLPRDWISMRSSALRKGDWVTLFAGASLEKVGSFRLAFVKDQTEQEVTDPGGGLKAETLDRAYSTAEISHVELIATLAEYGTIRDTVASEGGVLIVSEPRYDGENAGKLENPEKGKRGKPGKPEKPDRVTRAGGIGERGAVGAEGGVKSRE